MKINLHLLSCFFLEMCKTIFLFCILFVLNTYLRAECPIKFCNGTQHSTGLVENFCEREEGIMQKRCCIVNETIIGLDARSCQIEKLNIDKYNFSSILIMDLRDNKLENITIDDLIGLTVLNELYLPSQDPCPGGNNSWSNITSNKSMTACQNQINPCLSLNISCTENGQCLHTGPGAAKCICKAGHHGYKCLEEGNFPTTIFQLSLFSSTFAVCIVLWFAIGRDINKSIYRT